MASLRLLLALMALIVGSMAQDYSEAGTHKFTTTSEISYTFPRSTGCYESALANYCDTKIQVTFPTTSGSFPLAVYNNGFGMDKSGYLSFAEHLGSWGYVAIRWNPKESNIGGATQAARGKMAAEIITWAFDQTRNPSSPVYGKIDTSKGVIQAGHSLGGKCALLAAVHNPVVVGLVLMDPVDCPPPMPPGQEYGEENPDAIAMMNQTKAVGAFIGAEMGDIGELVPCASVDCNYQRYYNNATSPAWEVMVTETGHSQWIDGTEPGRRGGCGAGPQDTNVVNMISRTILVAWSEFVIYGRDISHWTSTWINQMRTSGYAEYRLK